MDLSFDIESRYNEMFNNAKEKKTGSELKNLNSKVKILDDKIGKISEKIADLEQESKTINEKLESHEVRMDKGGGYRKVSKFLNDNPIVGIILSAVIGPLILYLAAFSQMPSKVDKLIDSVDDLDNRVDLIDKNLAYVNGELGIKLEASSVCVRNI